jgi:hypothetical protein
MRNACGNSSLNLISAQRLQQVTFAHRADSIAGSQPANSALPNRARSALMIGALRSLCYKKVARPPEEFLADCSSEAKQGAFLAPCFAFA